MKYIALLLAAAMAIPAHACNVCGGAAGSQYLGVLPQASRHFVSFQYQYSSFESRHPSLFEGRPDEHSRGFYNSYQLWGRLVASRRIQFFAFVPWRDNQQIQDTVRFSSQGIGDVTVLANVLLLSAEKGRHELLAGGGIKLPTGSYDGLSEASKLGIPNTRPGSGSWDFVLNVNYTATYANYGVNTDASYTLTTPNGALYKFGNRLSSGLLVFRSFQSGRIGLAPQLGLRYEYSLHDYDNYKRKWLNEQTGGQLAFFTIGMQTNIDRLGCRLTWQLPFYQHYGNGYVEADARIDTGVFLTF